MNQQPLNQPPVTQQEGFANAARGLRHVFVQRLSLQASIGIHPHERTDKQRIYVSVDAAVAEQPVETPSIEDVVCYESISKQIAAIIARGHIDLVETLAEMIADEIMADARILRLHVKVEKPDAIEAAESVGIAIERVKAG